MPRAFSEKIRDPNYWLEQAAHAWIGFAVSLSTASIAGAFTPIGTIKGGVGLIASLIVGIGREVWQNIGDEDNDYADLVLDIVFVFLGGVLGLLPWWILRSGE